MFSQASVIMFTGDGGVADAAGRHPPTDTPFLTATALDRHPRTDTPLGRHPLPGSHCPGHPLPMCMLGYTHSTTPTATPTMAVTAADGTHPTGMHSCSKKFWLLADIFFMLQLYFKSPY